MDSELNRYQKYLTRWLKNFVYLRNLSSKLEFYGGSGKTFQSVILIYRKHNFVYHHLGCISIYIKYDNSSEF